MGHQEYIEISFLKHPIPLEISQQDYSTHILKNHQS